MSPADALSSAFSTAGEDNVDAKGEFSLVRVWSRSERPALVEETELIRAFARHIGKNANFFSAAGNRMGALRASKCFKIN